MYKYFCDDCGYKFSSDIPERNEFGLHNDIACPHCGSWCIYADDDAGRAESLRIELEYEEKAEGWYEDNAQHSVDKF